MNDESFYRHILKNANFGYASFELINDAAGKATDFRILEVNEKFLQKTGLPENEIVGKRALELFPVLYNCQFDWIGAFAAVSSSGKTAEVEQFFEPLSRWVRVEIISRKVNCISILVCDITEVKKEAEQTAAKAMHEKQQGEDRIRSIVEAMPDMIFEMQRDGTILGIIGAKPDLLVAPREQVIGTSIENCFPSVEFKRHLRTYQQCIEKNEKAQIEFELTINGKKKFFESWINPIDHERLLTFVRDKTEEKQLLERISDGFVAMDAQFNYIFVNEAAGRILGRPGSELVGKNYWTEFPEAKVTPFARAYVKAMTEQETIFIEEYYEPWDRWFSNAIYPSKSGLSIIFQEITQRKKTEKALQESEKKYAFLANSATDLANLTSLNEIYTYTAKSLNKLMNNQSIVAIVEYNNHSGRWRMQHIDGLAKSINRLTKIFGFDINKLEGDISTRYKEKILSGKLEEMAFDFPGLFNNKIPEPVGKMVKELMSIDQMYSIAIKQSEQLYGNITFVKTSKTGKPNAELIEAFVGQVTNFIKRFKAEKEANSNYELMKIAGQIAKFGGWSVDLDTNLSYWSDAVADIHGMPRGYVPEVKDGINFYAPEWRDKITQVFTDCAFNGVPYDEELEIIDIAGTRKWVRTIGKAVKDHNGKIYRVEGAFQDISDRKRDEAEIIRSNQQLESFLEISRNITKTWDQQKIMQLIVDNAVRIMGMQSGAIYLQSDDEKLKLAATTPPLKPDMPPGAKIAYVKDHPHIQQALTSGNHVIMADALATRLTPQEEEIVRLRNLRSNLYVPIQLREKSIGVLILSKHEVTTSFNNKDIQLLQGFANQAAHIIDNINNFEELIIYSHELREEIAQRREAEAEILKLSQAVEQSPVSVVITDLDGVIEYVNAKFTTITGYSLEEAKGHKPNIVKSGYQTDEVYKALWNTISADSEWRGELLNKKKNGEHYWESVSISPIFNKEGVKTHFIGIKEDITEKKKTEEKLLEAHKISKLGTYEFDLRTRLFDVSANMAEIYGFGNKMQFTFDEWLRSVHPDDHQWILTYLSEAIAEKRHETKLEFRIIRIGDRVEKWIHSAGKIKYDEQGEAVAILGTSRDITDIKIYQQELISAKEKAEESNRLKTAFLQNLSHEVRTPLNGIIGFSEIINDPDITAADRKRFTDIIIERGWQLTSIINDILTMSSIETSQVELYTEKFDLLQLIENHLEVYKAPVARKGLQLKSTILITADQSIIYGDKPKIGQILNNLFNNALKFTRQGSIELGISLNDDKICFYVRDTGIGIGKEYQSLIFERFTQADETIRRDFGGTGLGLSICKGFIELMGGEIRVESEPEQGATFYFDLPYLPAAKSKTENPAVQSVDDPDRKATILIAEDEDANFFALSIILSKQNFEVIRAINGLKAVEICSQQAVDLILMDIRMPVMDGYTAALRIRETKPQLPIIAQTAYAAQVEVAQYGSAFDDYITKPFTKEKINSCLSRFLKR